jgi:hypothetical protein
LESALTGVRSYIRYTPLQVAISTREKLQAYPENKRTYNKRKLEPGLIVSLVG